MSLNLFLATLADQDKILIAIISFIAFSIYKIIDKRNQSGRPPLLGYTIPWLGSAIELGKDPDALFRNATKAFGPVFRIKAAGREFTYITASELISAIYRDSKTFEFLPIRLEMCDVLFGMSKQLCSEERNFGDYIKAHHDGLSAKNVQQLHQRYGTFAYERLQKSLDCFCGTNKITKLASFVKPPFYDAAIYAFFGKTYPAAESYGPFQTFDKSFLLLQTGLPRFILRKYLNARERIAALNESYILSPHEDCSGFIRDMEGLLRGENWPLRDIAKSFVGDIWALQTNAIQAAYWILALLLQKPEGLTKIIEEIDGARYNWTKDNPNIKDDTHCQWVLEGSFPLLTSVIQESLRYCSAVFSIRLLTKETTLGGYRIRKGDYVLCHTRSVHMDNDIHKNPTEFIPERYMTKTEKYTKNGRIVPNHSIPFGGGASMCEGRHFAMGELKIFIALLLSTTKIELDPSSSERPRFDWSQSGTGVMPPEGDLSVCVTRRAE